MCSTLIPRSVSRTPLHILSFSMTLQKMKLSAMVSSFHGFENCPMFPSEKNKLWRKCFRPQIYIIEKKQKHALFGMDSRNFFRKNAAKGDGPRKIYVYFYPISFSRIAKQVNMLLYLLYISDSFS